MRATSTRRIGLATCLLIGAVTLVPGGAASAAVGAGNRFCATVESGVVPGDLAIVNLTPVGATRPGNGQLISSDVAQPPVASNVNFGPGTIDPNVAVAPVGADGQVCFANSANADVDIVIDLLGAIRAGSYDLPPTGAPVRLVDTRIGTGGTRLGPDARLCFPTGADPGSLAVINLTPVGADAANFGVLSSSTVALRPTASNVNMAPGTIDPNLGVATIGPDGGVCFWNGPHGNVDLVADLLVTITPGTFTVPTGGPRRLLDTRSGVGGPFQPWEGRCFAAGATPGALAIVNLTPLNANAPGYASFGNSDIPDTEVSNVNFAPGTVDPNVAVATVGANGTVCFLNSPWAVVDVVVDLLATVTPSSAAPAGENRGFPVRIADSRPAGTPVTACPWVGRCFRANPHISISTDGGTTWTLSQTAVPYPLAIDEFRCSSSEICVAAGDDGRRTSAIWKRAALVSLDGGQSWKRPAGVGIVEDLTCSAACVAIGDEGFNYRLSRRAAISTDDGRTWRDLPLPTDAGGIRTVFCPAIDVCHSLAYRGDGNGGVAPVIVEFRTTDGWVTVTVTVI